MGFSGLGFFFFCIACCVITDIISSWCNFPCFAFSLQLSPLFMMVRDSCIVLDWVCTVDTSFVCLEVREKYHSCVFIILYLGNCIWVWVMVNRVYYVS